MFPRTCNILVLIAWRVLLSLWSYWLISIFLGLFSSHICIWTQHYCIYVVFVAEWYGLLAPDRTRYQYDRHVEDRRYSFISLYLFLPLFPPPFLCFLLLIYKFWNWSILSIEQLVSNGMEGVYLMRTLYWLIVVALDRRLHHLVLLMYQLLQMACKGDSRSGDELM